MSRSFYQVLTAVLVVATGVFSWILYLHQRSRLEDLTYIPKSVPMTREIEWLREYVRIDTSNPPGNEIAGVRFLAARLREAGIEPEIIEPSPGRASLYVRLRGRVPGEGLMLLHHVDVVPASADGWTSAPFEGRIHKDAMIGRGVLDMKGIGISHLAAFLSIAAEDGPPEHDLVFLATADEETGSRWGMDWLSKNRPDLFEGIRYAISEGGVTETIANRIAYFGIETGSKQFVDVALHAPSREILERVRIELEPFAQPADPQEILPEVREYFHAVSSNRVDMARLLADIDQTVRDGEFWRVEDVYRELTQNNVMPKGIHQDADGWALDIAMLNLPTTDPVERVRWLEQRVNPLGVSVEVRRSMGPAPISSTSNQFFDTMRDAIQKEYGMVPVGPMVVPRVTTDCRYLRARGVQCYGMWPFPVDFFSTKGIHGKNERLRIDWFMRGVNLTRQVARRQVVAE